MLLYLEKIPVATRAAFEAKVIAISNFLGTEPNYLMQIFYAESKVNPQAQNIQGGRLIAAGLLQWTKASGMVGAPAAALKLTALQQLDEVKKYFTPYRGRLNSYYDVYLATFFPAAVNKPDTYVLQTKNLSAALIAKQNPAVNIIKDNKITVAEFKEYVYKSVPTLAKKIIFAIKENPGTSSLVGVATLFFLGI